MIRSMIRLATTGKIVTGAALVAPALALTLGSAAAFAAMEPIHSDGMAVPVAKPDIAYLYPGEPVEVEIPTPRPDLQSILPRATRTVGEMYLAQTGQTTRNEETFELRSGEGLGKVLRRAGYGGDDIGAAVNAVSGRASLRALPVGLELRIADDGFAFTTRNGRDIFAIKDPEEGWIAFSAIRPVERYLAFAQGVIDDSIYRAAGNSDLPVEARAESCRVRGFSVAFLR